MVMVMNAAVYVQSKFSSQRTPRRVVFISGLPKDAVEGDIIQFGLPFGRMTNLILAKNKCQVRHLSLLYL